MSTLDEIPPFRHEPLRDPRSHIRLLQVLLADDTETTGGIKIHCRLTTHRFTPRKKSRCFFNTESQEVTPLYHTISYVWGSPDDTVSILVNNRRMRVRRNCEYALKQSAWYGEARYIWCDAICIDQTNNDEKGHQVYLMGDIYRNAQVVLACVGPHMQDSPALLQALRTHTSTMDRIAASATNDRCSYSKSLRTIFTSQPTDESRTLSRLARRWAAEEDANMDRLIPAMSKLLHRDYFSRTWVYQEVVLGRHIVLCCGCTRTPLYSLYGMLLAMEYLKCLSDDTIDRAWPLLRAGAFSWSSSERSLETLMCDVLPLSCTDPRDKVYAILSMVNWRRRREEPIYPDYTLDPLSLASKVLTRILQDGGEIRFDVVWEQLLMISENLRLCDQASGLDDAIYRRRVDPRCMDSIWPYLGLTAYRQRVQPDIRFAGFQLDKILGSWSFNKAPLNTSSKIVRFQLEHFEAQEVDMTRDGFFDADLAILLPEVARPGDWCLLPYWNPADGPGSLVLITRRESGKRHKIIGKGLGWREGVLREFANWRHDFLVKFGSEDLLVLCNHGGFSLNDFWDYSASRIDRLVIEEMKDYMRTGVCGRPDSSLAWSLG